MTEQFEVRKAALMNNYLGDLKKAVWLRQGDGRTQVIIRADAREPGDGVRLKGVSLFAYTLDKDGSLKFSRRVDADEARLEPNRWRLIGVREGAPGGAAIHSAQLTLPSSLTARTALQKIASAQSAPFWALPSIIARTEAAGFSATAYRLQLQALLATPLLYAAMSILAAAFSLRLFRSGGLSGLVASAVGLGFVFFFLNQLCGLLGAGGGDSPAPGSLDPAPRHPDLRDDPPRLHRGRLTSRGACRKEGQTRGLRSQACTRDIR